MFQVGDVVVCVKLPAARYLGAPIAPHHDMPVVRATYRISQVVTGYDGRDKSALGLNFIGMNHAPYIGYHADCYRKITKADEQFTAKIRRRKPAHSPAPVA